MELKIRLGMDWMLQNMRYIIGLKRMLMSVSRLDDHNYHVDLKDGKCKIIKWNMVISHGHKSETIYMFEVPIDSVHATIDDVEDSTLWHRCLGLMSEKGMKLLGLKGEAS